MFKAQSLFVLSVRKVRKMVRSQLEASLMVDVSCILLFNVSKSFCKDVFSEVMLLYSFVLLAVLQLPGAELYVNIIG